MSVVSFNLRCQAETSTNGFQTGRHVSLFRLIIRKADILPVNRAAALFREATTAAEAAAEFNKNKNKPMIFARARRIGFLFCRRVGFFKDRERRLVHPPAY